MPAPNRAFPFAVCASLVVHVAGLVTLLERPSRRASVSSSAAESPDVWPGETLDVSGLVESTAMPHEAEPPSIAGTSGRGTAAATREPAVQSIRPLAPRERSLRARSEHGTSTAARVDPDEALAKKILAYRPASGASEVDGRPQAAPSAALQPRAGGTNAAAPPRDFARAFTRAIPAAASGDPVWDVLSLGRAGSILVTVTVGQDGFIERERVHDSPAAPPSYLEHLAARTLMLLRGGRFELTAAASARETLRIDVSISERESAPLVLGFEAPGAGKPGRAYFQRASGRVVEARVTIQRTPSSGG